MLHSLCFLQIKKFCKFRSVVIFYMGKYGQQWMFWRCTLNVNHFLISNQLKTFLNISKFLIYQVYVKHIFTFVSKAFLPSSAIFSTTILVWSSLILNKAYFLFFFVLISWNASTTESSTVIPDCACCKQKNLNEFFTYSKRKNAAFW